MVYLNYNIIVFILILNILRIFSQLGFKSNPIGYMAVNDYTIRTLTTSTSRDNNLHKNDGFDEIGKYNFVSGEIAKFSCKSLMGANVIMYFYDQIKESREYTEIPGTKDNMATMYLKLTSSHHNNSYFSCKLSTELGNRVIQVNLYQRNMSLVVDYPRFKINDLILRPIVIKGVKADRNYLYEYQEDEIATVTTIVDKNYYGNIDCLFYMKENDELNVLSKPATEFKLKTELNKIDIVSSNSSIFCTVFAKQYAMEKYNLKDVTISLYLRSYDNKRSNFDPQITGLSWSKVLQKYKRYPNLGVIHYEYENDEELILSCSSSSGRHVSWTFDNTHVDSPTVKQENQTKKRSFILKKVYNKTKIKCSTDGSSTHLWLKRIIFEEIISEDENKSNSHEIIISVIAIVAILIILFTIWALIKLYKRKRKLEQLLQNSCYENLPRHNEGPIHLPHQWKDSPHTSDSAQNTDDAKIYTKPIPKHLRQKVHLNKQKEDNNLRLIKEDGLKHKKENEYAEINYAEPFRVKLEEEEGPYAEIVAVEESVGGSDNYANLNVKEKATEEKHDVKTQIDSGFTEKYVDLDLKTNADGFFKNENKHYVEIQHKNKEDNKYENVFNSERYENVHKTECIEPAYSEIHRIE